MLYFMFHFDVSTPPAVTWVTEPLHATYAHLPVWRAQIREQSLTHFVFGPHHVLSYEQLFPEGFGQSLHFALLQGKLHVTAFCNLIISCRLHLQGRKIKFCTSLHGVISQQTSIIKSLFSCLSP